MKHDQRTGGGRIRFNRLSAAFVRQVVDPSKYFDGHGLILKVHRNGSRQWLQRISIRGKRTELGLGSPPLVTLAEAREKAFDNRRIARNGGDPLMTKRQAAAIPTFEEAARIVHGLHKPTWSNEKHAKDFMTSLERYAFPRLGKLRISEVNTADVLHVLQPMWLETPETARRVRQRIGTILKWSIAKGWRQDNPAESISTALPKQDRRKKHMKALPYLEVANCLGVVQSSGAWISTKLALEFLVLTAARSREVREATW
jgi:hypothetical protein